MSIHGRLGLSALAAAALCAAFTARADPMVRKGGEWRSVITGFTPEPKTVELCLSTATAEQALAKLTEGKQCSRRDVKFAGSQVTIDFVSNGLSLKGTATMSGDSAYKADLTLSAGTGASAKSIHTTTDAKWIGACKPGETPQ